MSKETSAMAPASYLHIPYWLWLVAVLGVALSLAAADRARNAAEAEANQELAYTASQVTLRIEERLDAYALILRGAAAFWSASDQVERNDWYDYVGHLQGPHHLIDVEGIGFALHVPQERLAAHLQAIREEGFDDYTVQPAGIRSSYALVHYLEPFKGPNRYVLGYDMFSEPVRRAAMEQARDTGQAALTAKLQLVTESSADSQPAALMYVPVYHRSMPLNSIADRRAALLGWAYMPYRMRDLVGGILREYDWSKDSAISLHIYDGPEARADKLLFYNTALDDELASSSQWRQIDFRGRNWLFGFNYRDPHAVLDQTEAWLILFGGLILTFLLCALIASLQGTRVRAQRMSEELSETIQQREIQLEKAITRLQTIASRIPGMVYEFRLEANGHMSFPFASEGISHVYGGTPETVRHDATPAFSVIHPDDLKELKQSILQSSKDLSPWRHEYRVSLPSIEQDRWLFGDALPHRDQEGGVTWYGVIIDITERKEAEFALRAAHTEAQRFRTALDHVAAIIYIKDKDLRYTYANRAALENVDFDAESIIGRVDKDLFPKDTADRLSAIDRRVITGQHNTEEVVIRDSDGNRRVYLELKTPMRDNAGEIVGILGISSEITQLKEHDRQLEYLAHYDALTELPNRVFFAERLEQAMLHEDRYGGRLAVVYLDLDNFKEINDRYGHEAGDHLLITLAHRLRQVTRETDTLARLGGDEFVAVLVGQHTLEEAEPMLRRLLRVAAQPVSYEGNLLKVSASIGVTFYPQDEPLEADQLLRQADQAMYQAKLAGKGRFQLFDPEHDRSMRSLHRELDRVEQGLDKSEFFLLYQPKVNMRSGELIGAEALLRWQHPELGLLLPGQYLPFIEGHSLMETLGDWVLREALAQAAKWHQAGLEIPVSVNISARQLHQLDLAGRIEELLKLYPELPSGRLELEVLETGALEDLALVTDLLNTCVRMGVSVSLDDFGTGYSSLTYLKRLPASTVKVDQSFVQDVLDAPEDFKILLGILGMARAFERQVIAEGVETIEHGKLLLRLGCEFGQGFGIAKPMPAESLPAWYQEWRPPPSWAELSPIPSNQMPLIAAAVEHGAWRRQLKRALHSGEPHEFTLLESAHCRFCDWLQRHKERNISVFEQLIKKHSESHKLIDELVKEPRTVNDSSRQQAIEALCDGLDEHIENLLG
ncbi:EAL domain-containing protein [Parahaliea sp. F7430]|uniref:EAL domain-containing protein n=1 Tax=Sediminihaliea albiluteola TaxID=2758564 RepID=A0A7W2TTV1_9GAMM|nr:EAL domain-containing protein [Sediminihaliea albiluteola]MBA6411836.1 EAL domain-containing protein [Sediminihaliea albiluteola]